MKLLDTHLHLLYPDTLTYEWCQGVPALNKPFRVEDYAALLKQGKRGAVVERAMFMEVDVPEAEQLKEAQFFCDLADAGTSPVSAVIASCRPESAGFADHVEKLAQSKRVKGLRRVLHGGDGAIAQTPLFAENLNRLPRFGFTFDLCLRADQLRLGMALADRCPQVQFILDHCGNPAVAQGQAAVEPWLSQMKELAKRPNVACKISGVAVHADPKRDLTAQVRPFVEQAVAAFGFDRVVWGSDWPVCNLTFNLPAWLDATADLFAGCSALEREQVGFRNAERIYRM